MSPKTGALVAAILGSAVVSVDATVVYLALPAIAGDLGGGLAGQQWTVNAYLLVLSAFILVSGSLADLLGERRVFAAGVAGFGVTSVLCAAAPSIEVLVAARALQGLSGALLTPASLAIIVAVFAPAERGAAIGTWTAWSGIGVLAGPLLGGQLVDAVGWRAVFAINVPVVALCLVLAARHVPGGAPRAERRPRVDVAGAALCAAGLAGPTLALIEQPQLGWGDPRVWGAGLGGLAVFALFLRHEARTPEPMLPLGLFRGRTFAWGNVETLLLYGGLGAFSLFLGLFLQQTAGFSALAAGSVGIVPTASMFVLSRRFGALAGRFGPRRFMAGGPLVSAAGLVLLLRLDADVDYARDLLPGLLLFALGLAVFVAPLTAAVLADADERNAGIASGVNNAVARTAGLLATAAIGAAVAASFGARLDEELRGREVPAAAVERAKDRALAVPRDAPPALREAATEASVATYRLAMGAAAVLMALGGVVGWLGIRDPPRGAAGELGARAHGTNGQEEGSPDQGRRGPPRSRG